MPRKKTVYTPRPESFVTMQEIDDARAMMGLHVLAQQPPETIVVEDEQGELRSFKTVGWLKLSRHFLPYLERLQGCPLSVFLALAIFANQNNRCFPSVDTLAQVTGYKKRTVLYALKSLEEQRLIMVLRSGRNNTYIIRFFTANGKENPEVPIK